MNKDIESILKLAKLSGSESVKNALQNYEEEKRGYRIITLIEHSC